MRTVVVGSLALFVLGISIAILETRGVLELIYSSGGVASVIFVASLVMLLGAFLKRVWRLFRGV